MYIVAVHGASRPRSGCQLAYRRQPLAKTVLHALTSLRTCTVVPKALATISGRTSCQRCRRPNAATDRRGSPSIAADAASPNQAARTVARCGLLQRTYHQYPIAQRLRPAQPNRRPTPAYRLPPRLVAHRFRWSHQRSSTMEKRLRQHQPSPASNDHRSCSSHRRHSPCSYVGV